MARDKDRQHHRGRSHEHRTEPAGGSQRHRSRHHDGGRSKGRPAEVLPSAETLESYDYVVEGSARMILEMFEREQKHRHEWENRALKTHAQTTVLGQVLGFGIAVAVFVAAVIIGMYGDSTIAAFIWVFGMSIIVMAGIVWFYAKSMGQRPLFARPAMRASFRPEKKAEDREEE